MKQRKSWLRTLDLTQNRPVGDLEERVALVDKLMQDGKIAFLQEYITRKKKEVAHHGEEPENA